jgi:hypothetical protein
MPPQATHTGRRQRTVARKHEISNIGPHAALWRQTAAGCNRLALG